MRHPEPNWVEFRSSAVGTQAYVKGSSLAIWEVVLVARSHGMDAKQTAEYLEWDEEQVASVLRYAAAIPKEIQQAIEENDAYDFARLSQMVPQATQFVVED